MKKAAAGSKSATERRTWSRNREGKEQVLIRAFDTVLKRDGAHALGVNSVLQEAGVGKNLLYKYFGGLAGLARAWGRSSPFMPSDTEMTGPDPEEYAALSTAAQISRNYRNYAKALRKRPQTLEILAHELLQPNEVTVALQDVRDSFGKGMERFFTRSDEYQSETTVALSVILYAAVTYLSLRSRTAPHYLWYRLDQPAAWKQIDRMIDLLSVQTLAGAPAKRRGRIPARHLRTGAKGRKRQ